MRSAMVSAGEYCGVESTVAMRGDARQYQVLVVGAGAAGIGVAVALRHAGIEDFVVLDRREIGASFLSWPSETTFLTPSFPSNSFGLLDLNAIAIGTSPAHTLEREHPTGRDYARYLQAVAEHFELPVQTGVDVQRIEPGDEQFVLSTSAGEFSSAYVIWAAGEYQYPATAPFPGGELCRHSATTLSWRELPEETSLIIGGYESGIDAAIQLGALGRDVTVLSREETWRSRSSDPSVALSTYTRERLASVLRLGASIELIGDADIVRVEMVGGQYHALARDGRVWPSAAPPVLATGFLGSHRLVSELFEERPDGYPLLTECDESTTTPGLFLTGPMLRHDDHIFCFIYKFRQRFAVVAKAIADGLGLPAEELETYRDWGMYLDDLSCCGEECVC